MSEVPSKFMQKSDSKGSDNDSRHRRRENEGGGEDNHITRSEGHSPMRLSVDDNDGEQYAQSRPDSDPEEGAVADGDYSPLPGRPSFGGNDGGDNTGTRENADDNKTAASANPRPSSDSARFSQKIKSLGRGAGSAVNNATAGILSPATAAPEGFEVVRGDRCATRGEDSRGAGIGRCERRQSQVHDSQGENDQWLSIEMGQHGYATGLLIRYMRNAGLKYISGMAPRATGAVATQQSMVKHHTPLLCIAHVVCL